MSDLTTRLFQANIAAYEVATVYLGEKLGLYRALASLGSATAAELARSTGCDERYVREWLEQQAVAGILTADAGAAADWKFRIPPEHEAALLHRDDLAHLAPLARFTVGVYSGLPLLLDAFRTGKGVAYAAYGPDAREGQADVNRTMFVNLLGQSWLPALADVHERLRKPGSRVADMGCGTGWSSIAIARAYPATRVDGIDTDAPSIALARANAASAKVDDRVRFHEHNAADPQPAGGFDLVTIFEALHDMARPVDALREAKRMLGPQGSVLIADERTLEHFTAPGPESERLYYAWSVLFCLPTGREETPSAATGAVMRLATLEAYAREAGFTRIEVAPIEHDLWRFYQLWP